METQLDILKRKDDGIDLQLMIDWRFKHWDDGIDRPMWF
jgi:hypothetical protein